MTIEELNTKDAFVTSMGGGGISVKSLSGTCALTTAAQPQSGPISFTLTGQVGHVLASTGGAPISCNLSGGQGVPAGIDTHVFRCTVSRSVQGIPGRTCSDHERGSRSQWDILDLFRSLQISSRNSQQH